MDVTAKPSKCYHAIAIYHNSSINTVKPLYVKVEMTSDFTSKYQYISVIQN